jgi:gamma-tubulin complex component 2
MDSVSFGQRINTAYLSANTALLNLLIDDQSLFLRLKSLKHTFFMDQGDSFTHFLDLASHELSKKAKYVSISKLQSLLDVALRNPSSTSGTNADPYKEDIKIAISNSTLIDWLTTIIKVEGAVIDEQGGVAVDVNAGATPASATQDKKADDSKASLTGIEALSLDYNVEFPLSLVISRKAILGYQLIFRHLLSLKHLEQVLTTTWTEHTKSPAWRRRTNCLPVERWKRRVFTLRTRMLAFVQQMYSFAVLDVLETNWRKMMEKLQGVRTVDQLLKYHSDFLQTCLDECMLTNYKMLKVYLLMLV